MNCTLKRYRSGQLIESTDVIAPEEPLEIRIEGRPTAVLLRTPGDDIDLTVGFLFTEGVIEDFSDIHAIAHVDDPTTPQGNTIDVILASGVSFENKSAADRNMFASSSCGVCGKASIARIFCSTPPIPAQPPLSARLVLQLPEKLLKNQLLFSATGGIHASGLFDREGNLLLLREDIGRHNTVDKIIGAMLRLEREDELEASLLLVSGRAGFEIVQKSIVARIPWLLAIGAPSSLAVSLAQQGNLGLIGFLKKERFNCYQGSLRED
jgi:FdhD protein